MFHIFIATTSPCIPRTFSQTFPTGANPISQCAAWRTFTTSLICTNYSTIRIYGSNDPVGLNITTSTVVRGLILALNTNSSYSGTSNGHTWITGFSANGYEITSCGTLGVCAMAYTLRPCQMNQDWGGINGITCSAPTQTMSMDVA